MNGQVLECNKPQVKFKVIALQIHKLFDDSRKFLCDQQLKTEKDGNEQWEKKGDQCYTNVFE